MMLDLRMPGVYTYEKSSLPPTVAVIPSAVPVFIGYTEKAVKDGQDLTNKPTRIKSMSEYVEWFGGPQELEKIEVDVFDLPDNPRRPEVRIVKKTPLHYKMYHALQLYYANGGGPCYIMSVDKYAATPAAPDPNKFGDACCFKELKKTKDVTILVFPDGTSMKLNEYEGIIKDALMHCEKMKNRVTIIDVHEGDQPDKIDDRTLDFQNAMPSDAVYKKYGMAYYPFLHTTLANLRDGFDPKKIIIRNHIKTPEQEKALENLIKAEKAKAIADEENKRIKSDNQSTEDQKVASSKKAQDNADEYKKTKETFIALLNGDTTKTVKTLAQELATAESNFKDASYAHDTASKANPVNQTNVASALSTKTAALNDTEKAKEALKKSGNFSGASLKILSDHQLNDKLFNKIVESIKSSGVIMPPSAAIAGIFVRTDATQGVWKAPANVSVFGTIKPAIELDDDDHASLNAPDNGKAINVIRAYPGRGTLVYGGRTLACNDLEWRYVNVRRTFCFIEDTIARAMLDFVFEPNTPQTWIRVKSMITSFLNSLWKAGGLYGNTPDDAFEVIVGEPESMSVEDVLGGIMKIIIKVAVARPAEFIVLQYEHKFSLSSN